MKNLASQFGRLYFKLLIIKSMNLIETYEYNRNKLVQIKRTQIRIKAKIQSNKRKKTKLMR